jgi:putative MFS transporter
MSFSTLISKLDNLDKATLLTIFIAALGYFVDAFDMLLFGVVRVPSLKNIGVANGDILSTGLFLINLQMAGLLVGGFLWGVLGDKFGRLSVLLGSILLYSAASFANAFVDSVTLYGILRFVAGVGLAGELGIGVTLISEILPQQHRGLGTAFLGTVGMLGAVTAGLVGDSFSWRIAYGIGGVMGFILLLMRIRLKESQLYLMVAKGNAGVKRGHLLSLFFKPSLLRRYIAVILIPLPLLTMIWILVAFTPEFAKSFGANIPLQAGKAIVFCYIGMTIGDALSGLLSQFLKSRRKAIAWFLLLLAAARMDHLVLHPATAESYYASCLFMGIAGGYWIVAIQLGAEQFGTNIRATAATSVPTVARALIIPATMGFKALTPITGVVFGWAIIMAVAFSLSILSLLSLKDSFHSDMNYVE